MNSKELLKLSTRVIHSKMVVEESISPVMPAIYPTTLYKQKKFGEAQPYVYTRTNNPTRESYENCVTDLESGKYGFSFASGMAAISTIFQLLTAGSHVIISKHVYGGTYRVMESVLKRSANLSASYVDMTDPSQLEAAIKPNTCMIWAESPTNPLLKIMDLAAVTKIARSKNILSVMDNTFATPLLQRPLEWGFDIVVHSATKYLNGHSDVLNGVVVIGDNAALAEQVGNLQKIVGAVPSPFDCYLALRGIKTLALRMERHCHNALELAKWLETQPQIKKVYYPGLPSHPQHALAKKQMAAFGGVVTIDLKGGLSEVKRFVESCRLFTLSGSLGGVESLVGHPTTMSHRSLSPDQLIEAGLSDSTLRLSVGVEDVDDLKADLHQAFVGVRS
jgi:cystathionine beta-lyase/cystathionine gamma-synthase